MDNKNYIPLSEIPKPKSYGPLKNLPVIDFNRPTLSMMELGKELGPIYKIEAPGNYEINVLWGNELVKEVIDESRFDKLVTPELLSVRDYGGDGLFTAWTHEENWKKAHNILLPAFSQQAMKGYHSMMLDIAQQMIDKWSRLNSDDEINVPDDMTKLTLDTIALCGFNYRFNSFYREKHDQFVESMVNALDESMRRPTRPKIQSFFMNKTHKNYRNNINVMFELVDKIVSDRVKHGDNGEMDLLARMLEAEDPETGEKLDSENIRYQILTFLIAGHETTSGLLSFTLYYLLKNPEIYKKAIAEVDNVVGGEQPTYKQISKLSYIKMILNESLRLWPTAPGFDVYAKEETVIGEKYFIKKGEGISVLTPLLHRDKDVWGPDAEEFKPERFSNSEEVPYHAFKPFGNGLRGCIGMQFALHEATLIIAMILQNFNLVDHTDYELEIQQTLTLKPNDFRIRIKPREDKISYTPVIDSSKSTQALTSVKETVGDPLLVLYGSNLGTAEEVARELSDSARRAGLSSDVKPLDSVVNELPEKGTVLIVTASYNGKPPVNGRNFVEWLDNIEQDEVKGLNYAVLGCGDPNWSTTYQAIPRHIDDLLFLKGANRIIDKEEFDVSNDLEFQLETWRKHSEKKLWAACGLNKEIEMKDSKEEIIIKYIGKQSTIPVANDYGTVDSVIIKNTELHGTDSERSTKHIELQLPDNIHYAEGDHLGVLPTNREDLISRVLQRYRLKGSECITLTFNSQSYSYLPLEQPVEISTLLRQYLELQEPATRAQIRSLIEYTECPPHKKELEALLINDSFKLEIINKRVTMLGLLEQYPACQLPFEKFIALLPALKPRYYSISSSPNNTDDKEKNSVSLTVGVVKGKAWNGQGEYYGVASNYLAETSVGDIVAVFVRKTEFKLPSNSETPIIMIGPGTGIAPFRGFLQARSELKSSNVSLGKAKLFTGFRRKSEQLYLEELKQYELDSVELNLALSRETDVPKTYVQDMILEQAEALINDIKSGGYVYICGDGSKMAPDVERAFQKAYSRIFNLSEEEANTWWSNLESENRYMKDVWSN